MGSLGRNTALVRQLAPHPRRGDRHAKTQPAHTQNDRALPRSAFASLPRALRSRQGSGKGLRPLDPHKECDPLTLPSHPQESGMGRDSLAGIPARSPTSLRPLAIHPHRGGCKPPTVPNVGKPRGPSAIWQASAVQETSRPHRRRKRVRKAGAAHVPPRVRPLSPKRPCSATRRAPKTDSRAKRTGTGNRPPGPLAEWQASDGRAGITAQPLLVRRKC